MQIVELNVIAIAHTGRLKCSSGYEREQVAVIEFLETSSFTNC